MKKIILILLITTYHIVAGGVFSVGNKHMGFTIGTDNSFGNNYTVLGANINYFIVDNLSIGASYQTYLGDDPTINDITVPVTYYIPLEGTSYRPYLGAFYNHTFIDDPYEDYDIYGGRLGFSLQTSTNTFVSFGWVQEFTNSSGDDDTESRGYPEVSAGFAF